MSKKMYSETDMQSALSSIKSGLPIRKASKEFKIPRGTLQNRIHNRTKKSRKGPETILKSDEEKEIVDWLVANHFKGFPRRKDDVKNVVKEFLDADARPRKNPFKDNLPGKKWYESFLRRHPSIAIRTPEPVTDASSKVSEKDIRGWFAQIKLYLRDKNFAEILDDPTRIFNGDETNFMMCPKTRKVLAPKGSTVNFHLFLN